MRSGTNAFRGTAWEFNRNDALNAVGFFKPTGGVKPKLNRNQFGFVFGGPILRNRTFFFTDYEGFRQISKALTFASIPTLEQRQGILGKPILNPLTGEIYANGVIPSSAITPFARQVLAGLPAPTQPGIANNFDSLPRREDYNDKYDVKVDHQFSTRMTAFGRWSHRKVDNFEPPPIPGETGSPSNAFVHVLNEQFAGGFTYTLTPTSLLEMRLGVSRTKAGKEPPGVGGPTMLELYGITGLPTDPRFAGGLTEQGVTGWTTWGRQNSNPQFQDPSVINPRINYSWLRRPSELQDRLRVPGDQHADRRLQPEVRPRHLRRASSAVRPTRGRRPGHLQPRRLHVRRAQQLRAHQPVHRQPAPADALRLRAGRLQGQPAADAEPRPALRVRHAAVGEGQLPHQLRSGRPTR